MATSKSTTHPSAAQGRPITTTPLKSSASVLEFPKIPEYPPIALRVCGVTNLELRMVFELERNDGTKPEGSPSELKLIRGLEKQGLVHFHERVNRWRLTEVGELILEIVRTFTGTGGEIRPLKAAKVLTFPSRMAN